MTRRLLIGLVDLYRAAAPSLLPPACRFEPSCSRYAREALETRGTLAALGLTAGRLLRCHPYHPGGFDPVPAPRPARAHP